MITKITLAQTLSEDWVVTCRNPFEDGWETELARFATGESTAEGTPARKALEEAAALTAARFGEAYEAPVVVESHITENRKLMEQRVYGQMTGQPWVGKAG